MFRPAMIAFAALLSMAAAAPASAVTLTQAMDNPDWIGPPIERPYWSLDGRSVYFQLKQDGNPVRDLHRIASSGGGSTVIDPKAMADADGPAPTYDRTRRHAAFVRSGDIFVRELSSGRLIQVTRTPDVEASPQFSADGHAVQYRVGSDWFSHDIASGVSGPAAVIKLGKDPDAKKPDDMAQVQQRLFSTLRTIKSDRDARKASDDAFASGDPTRAPRPVHVGDDIEIQTSALSPDGRRLLLVATPKGYDAGRVATMQKWVTESGYEEGEPERPRVGRNLPAPQRVIAVDLSTRTATTVSLADLPGIGDDPLKAIRAENAKEIAAIAEAAGKPVPKSDDGNARRGKDKRDDAKATERNVTVADIQWSPDGRHVAVQLRAIDNKDRWIAGIDFERQRFVSEHRLTDPAWINWDFNEFGWTADSQRLWYLSEESGYSRLYIKAPGGKAKALTPDGSEASMPVESPDGRWFYLRSNALAPYSYDAYRVAADGGELQRITRYEGTNAFVLSPDGSQLAVLHSSAYVPPQLAIANADGSGTPRELTDTRTAAFKAIDWQMPQIVGVPSSHAAKPIWSKLYKPAGFDPSKKYPAVLFVHGAGYLQNTHKGYPNYFREQMFHNLLTERGYVVLDMDFRASEGYGRDWRTAIYRQMGTPELQDYVDGVDWLEKHHAVDRGRIGIYGGSYGGFMSLMALFREPGLFKAGAALRPVTDWYSYNHEYTSNILNTPQDDPIAYRRSSPIEYAEGFNGHLLIAHGMIDDNVLFQDSVRLFQRLVELRKENFELAPYPVERHGFVHADSWYDEYRRILKLFDDNLK